MSVEDVTIRLRPRRLADMEGPRWTRDQVEKLALVIARVSELPDDQPCPFGCASPGHAPDCPVTATRDLMAFGRELET